MKLWHEQVGRKIAVITGGIQRLGAAIARKFVASGATGIVTCGRKADKGTAVAEPIIRDTGVQVYFVVADLGNVSDCRTQLYKPTNISKGSMYW